ncbi:MAG: assimilatory nitrate reductase electron transfer subunit, partial [Actinomycetota bacterium]|nr:assimilatory nitrate reductase electron transfer subunit [Actinomycetota bacterium]
VGDLSRIGLLTQLYDRKTVLGHTEPAQLILGERPTGESSVRLPDEAEVCSCATVTAGQIRSCATLPEAIAKTRATTGCGTCLTTVTTLLTPHPQPAI